MNQKDLLQLSVIAKEFGVTHNYLRFLIFKKKLRAVKVGKSWNTTREWFGDYLKTIVPRKAVNRSGVDLSAVTSVEAETAFYPAPKPDSPSLETRLAAIEENFLKIQENFIKAPNPKNASGVLGDAKPKALVFSQPSVLSFGKEEAEQENDKKEIFVRGELAELKNSENETGLLKIKSEEKSHLNIFDKEFLGLEVKNDLPSLSTDPIHSFWNKKPPENKKESLFSFIREKLFSLFSLFPKNQNLSLKPFLFFVFAVIAYSIYASHLFPVLSQFNKNVSENIAVIESYDLPGRVAASYRNVYGNILGMDKTELFSDSFASILSEARKYRSNLTLASLSSNLENLKLFMLDLPGRLLSLPQKLSSSFNFLVDSLVDSLTPVSPKLVKPQIKELVASGKPKEPSAAKPERTAVNSGNIIASGLPAEAPAKAGTKQSLNQKTAPAGEVIEKREIIIPADLASVRSDFSTKIAQANLALKTFFESSINEVKESLSRTSQRTDSSLSMVTLTQRINQLDSLDAVNGINIKSGGLDIQEGSIVIASGNIIADTITSRTGIVSSAATSTLVNLSITGNATLGDSSLDSLTLNSSNLVFNNRSTTTIASSNASSFVIATSSARIPFMTFDTSNYRVGIGTSTPGTTFSVGGNVLVSGTLDVGGVLKANSSSLTVNNIPTVPHTFSSWSVGTTAANATTSTLVINPASAVSDTNLLGILVNDSVKFLVDAEGDVFVNSLTSQGSVTSASTTAASLLVEGSFYGGDSITDLFSINSGNIVYNNRATSTIPNLTVNAWSIATSSTITPTFTISTASSPFGLVGIGTTSPFATLSIQSPAGTSQPALFVGSTTKASLIVDGGGNVGIGTTSPGTLLSVGGDEYLTGILGIGTSNFISSSAGDLVIKNASAIRWNTSAGDDSRVGIRMNADSSFTIQPNNSGILAINPVGGNVGIGTTGPWDPLSVIGDISLTGGDLRLGTGSATTTLTTSATAFAITANATTTLGTTGLNIGSGQFVVQQTSGNVGIGITNPGAKLQVKTSTDQNIVFRDSFVVSGGVSLTAVDDAVSSAKPLELRAADVYLTDSNTGLSVLVAKAGGNVGIGTTTPGQKLSVAGDILGNNFISSYFTSTSTAATSTLAGVFSVGSTTPASNSLFSVGTSSPLLFVNKSSGNVGIGTAGPAQKIEIADGSIALGRRPSTQTTKPSVYIGVADTDGSFPANGLADMEVEFLSDGSQQLHFSTNNWGVDSGRRLTIGKSGLVGIGTTSPGGLLSVSAAGTVPAFLLNQTSTGDLFTLQDSGSTVFTVKDGGNVGIGTTTPGLVGYGRALTISDSSNNVALELRGGVSSLGSALAGIDFFNAKSTKSDQRVARIFAINDATTFDAEEGELTFWTTNTSGVEAERMRINSDGNVGIGTTTPLFEMEIGGSGDTLKQLVVTNTDTGTGSHAEIAVRNAMAANSVDALRMIALSTSYTDNGAWVADSGVLNTDTQLSGGLSIGTRHASAPIRFYTAGITSERMRITETGNVGIGTSTPGALFSVAASGAATAGINPGNLLFSGVNTIYASSSTTTIPTAVNALSFATSTTAGFPGLSFNTSSSTAAGPLVGIGTANPQEVLHLRGGKGADTGVTSIRMDLTGSNPFWLIRAQDGANNAARLLDFWTSSNNLGSVMTLTQAGNVFINDTSNANMTGPGLTINQGGSDNEILSFKSSDVTHGGTGVAETDTFAYFNKVDAGTGGLIIGAINASTAPTASAMELNVVAGAEDTGKSATVRAMIETLAHKLSGTGATNVSADSNIFGVRRRTGGSNQMAFLVDAEGDVHYDGTTNAGAWDVAEKYPTQDNSLEAGDIVVADSQEGQRCMSWEEVGGGNLACTTEKPDLIPFVSKSTSPRQINALGIVSTKPGVLLGGGLSNHDYIKYKTIPLGLVGQVPTKVSLEAGPIAIGDRITSSSLAGIGMKATTSGMTVGIALENFDGTLPSSSTPGVSSSTPGVLPDGTEVKTGKILVFVNLGYSKLDSELVKSDFTSGSPTSNGWSVDQTSGKVSVSFFGALNLNGNEIINVSRILGMDGKWKIDENGKLVVKEIETEKIKSQKGYTVPDEDTGSLYCIKVKSSVLVALEGECGTNTQQNINQQDLNISTFNETATTTESIATTTETTIPETSTTTEPVATSTPSQ